MANFKNRTVWIRDNIDVLRGINSDSIDLIYLDPPFNSKANYAAPIGSKAAGAAFKDTWSLSDVDVEWVNLLEAKQASLRRVLLAPESANDRSYLTYMAERLLEMYRILSPSGSLYLHCDPTMSHYLKLVLDSIFGRDNFRNEIIWAYAGGGIPKQDFPRKHDIIFRYAKTSSAYYSPVYRPYSPGTQQRGRTAVKGKYFETGLNPKGTPVNDWWTDVAKITSPTDPEKVGYPTQKPVALLRRILSASVPKIRDEDDAPIVLDPFCGCATTLVAAEDYGCRWIGVDISEVAGRLVRERLHDPKYKTFYPHAQIFVRDTDLPVRSDLGPLPHPSTHKNALYGEQGGNCQGCGQHFLLNNLEVDHIIARARGGTDEIGNLQLLCGHCNKVKGSRGMAYLKAKLQIS